MNLTLSSVKKGFDLAGAFVFLMVFLGLSSFSLFIASKKMQRKGNNFESGTIGGF
jgi:hypothetical protein